MNNDFLIQGKSIREYLATYLRVSEPTYYLLLRMKLTTFLIIALTIQASAFTFGQSITLSYRKATLKTVIKALSQQGNIDFVYKDQYLQQANPVSLDLKNASVEAALKAIFSDQPFLYEITDGIVYITPKPKEIQRKEAPKRTEQQPIRGKITDDKGEPLAGATIRIKGSGKQLKSDQSGEFILSAEDTDAVIEVSYMGYANTELSIKGRSTVQIAMQPTTGMLDQVVIQGYGTTTKRLATGNIATVDAKTIEQQPVMNVLQTLNGRVAGVQVTQNSSIPGSSLNIKIRGTNSLSASNRPLFVIDDVPFAMDPLPSAGYFSAIEPTNIINPGDIESITILKDADATAIYGSRAANGVVLITTKKAKAGKTRLDVSLNRGFSNVSNVVEVMNTEQYLQMRRDAFANSGATPTASTAPDLLTWDPNSDNKIMDWYIGNTADIHDVAASFSGGNISTVFLLSGNYHQESNVFSDKNKYKRGNLHFTVNHTSPDQRLKISFSGLYGNENNRINNNGSNSLSSVSQAVPNYPYFDDSGNYNWLANLNNIYALHTAYSKFSTQNLNINLKGVYEISDRFNLITSVGLRNLFNNNISVYPYTAKDPNFSNPLGNSVFNNNNSNAILVEPQLSYKEIIFQGKINVLLGTTVQKSYSKSERLAMNMYLSDLLMESRNGGSFQSASTDVGQYNFVSIFSRLNYNWKDRYVFNGTLRRDGSGRFGPNKRFGNFGSIGAAWIVSNERFLKDHRYISYAKLRGSYGTTGSDGIGDFGYLSLYTTLTDYGTQKAISPSQIANPDYQWEVTKKLEFAGELGFLKDRILVATAWYRNRSGNQLVTYPLPMTTGFSGYTANLPALVENRGWEFELNTVNIENNTFLWRSDFTLTVPENRLLEFPNIEQTSFANTHVIGKPLNSYLAYQLEQIDPATGLATVVDVSGNGTINANSSYNNRGGDKVWVGSANPDWFAGLNNSFAYRGVQLDIFWQYTRQIGYNLFSSGASFSTFGTLRNGYAAYLDYWKEPGQEATIPKPFSSSNTSLSLFSQSDRAISDASFLRLKTVALNYQLPSKLINKWGMSNLQITAQGQNLLTFTDYAGSEPEMAPSTALAISALRTFSFGIKSSF